jgi:uncharacterized damage-inducible protein DinB
MNAAELLVSPIIYLAPDKLLDGLSSADAERRVAATTHSIAEIVAHLSFWQEWFLARCRGSAVPMVTAAADGWPPVDAGAWPGVQARFFDGLQQLAALGDGNGSALVTPALEFPPLAHYTIADALVHVATHNSHHLGQVVVLRQLLGTWPPPAGSWTW